MSVTALGMGMGQFVNKEDEFDYIEHGRTALFLAAEGNHPHAVAAFVANDDGAEVYHALTKAADQLRAKISDLREASLKCVTLGWIDKWTDGWMDGCVHESMVGWLVGWLVGWTD